jgi:hypothetical protein
MVSNLQNQRFFKLEEIGKHSLLNFIISNFPGVVSQSSLLIHFFSSTREDSKFTFSSKFSLQTGYTWLNFTKRQYKMPDFPGFYLGNEIAHNKRINLQIIQCFHLFLWELSESMTEESIEKCQKFRPFLRVLLSR